MRRARSVAFAAAALLALGAAPPVGSPGGGRGRMRRFRTRHARRLDAVRSLLAAGET